jgi:hypothetical protein
VWGTFQPMFELAFQGEGGWLVDKLFELKRNNYSEECYFTCSFSPIYNDDGTIAGVLTPLIETTKNIVSSRRCKVILGIEHKVPNNTQSTCAQIMEAMKTNPFDIPFAMLYLINQHSLVLMEALNVTKGSAVAPAEVSLNGEDGCHWPFNYVLLKSQLVEVDQLEERFGPLPGGAWPDPPQKAVVLPIFFTDRDSTCGILIVGMYSISLPCFSFVTNIFCRD